MAVPQSTQDTVVLLMVSGLGRAALEEAVGRLAGIDSGESSRGAIAAARRRVALAATINHDLELGASLSRMDDLYRRALLEQDTATALSVERQRVKLLQLDQQPQTTVDAPNPEAAELAKAREQLEPLGLTDQEEVSVGELCRLAVCRIVDLTQGSDDA